MDESIKIIILKSLSYDFDNINDLYHIVNSCLKGKFETITLRVLHTLLRNNDIVRIERGTYNITEQGLLYVKSLPIDAYDDMIKTTIKESELLCQAIEENRLKYEEENRTHPIKSKYLQPDGRLKENIANAVGCWCLFHVDDHFLYLVTHKEIQLVPGTLLCQPDIKMDVMGPIIDL